MSKNELTIIGMDPGTTTGVAVLGLDGEIKGIKSSKGFDRAGISEFIISKGKPIIVATDVSKAPSLVEKIASTFGAQLYIPEEDLTKDKKEELSEGIEYKDSHQLDAAASAVLAFKENKSLFERIENKLRRRNKKEKFEDVLLLVMNNSMSVKSALNEMEKAERTQKSEIKEKRPRNWKKIALKRRDRLKEKDREIKNLKKYVEKLENEMEELNDRNEKLENLEENMREEIIREDEIRKRTELVRRKQKEIEKQERDLGKAKKEIKELKDAVNKLDQNWRMVPIVENEKKLKESGKEIIYLERNINLDEMNEKVKAIISSENISEAEKFGVPVVQAKNLNLIRRNKFYLVEKKGLKRELDKTPSRFLNWIEEYKNERKR